MEKFFYPSPEIRTFQQHKWESWNKLRTATPGRRSNNIKKSSQNLNSSLASKRESDKTFVGDYLTSNSKNILEMQLSNRKMNNTTVSIQRKKSSIVSIEELLLLETDLFTEAPQIKAPISHKEIIKKKNIVNIELKGRKVKFTPINSLKPVEHKFLLKETPKPKIGAIRSSSVNKHEEKRKIQDTPGPWGNDKSIENLNNAQKIVVKNKHIGYLDNFTST